MDGCRLRMVEERGASKASAPSVSQCERVDRRVLRSRAAMVAAFEDLLAEKAYEDITVTDIARKADVDRKTFYKHFGSIDGLLAYVLDSHIDDIVENTHGLLACTGEGEQGHHGEHLAQAARVRVRPLRPDVHLHQAVHV